MPLQKVSIELRVKKVGNGPTGLILFALKIHELFTIYCSFFYCIHLLRAPYPILDMMMSMHCMALQAGRHDFIQL
jgi:hypothetical protein